MWSTSQGLRRNCVNFKTNILSQALPCWTLLSRKQSDVTPHYRFKLPTVLLLCAYHQVPIELNIPQWGDLYPYVQNIRVYGTTRAAVIYRLLKLLKGRLNSYVSIRVNGSVRGSL